MITAVDTNVLIDVLEPDPVHGRGSLDLLRRAMREGSVVACDYFETLVLLTPP